MGLFGGALIVISALLLILAAVIISIYNNLVRLKTNRENAFADIDVQLQQRLDMIPQLVDVVKGYMKHENETLTKVIQARNEGAGAVSIEDKITADQKMSSALNGLKVTVEAYPELKANENFMHLQGEIADTENKLSAARRYFNSATKEYNTACEVFPNVVFAGMFGHSKKEMFDIVSNTGLSRMEANKAPKIGSF